MVNIARIVHMSTVTKKPKGTITIRERHRTTSGNIYRPNEVIEYYLIVNRKEGCGCPGTTMVNNTYYQIKGGLIPTSKAILNES